MSKSSDISNKLIFIVGCPRSGTTWLQGLLVDAFSAGTGAETDLFTYYINKLDNAWNKQLNVDSRSSRGKTGLPYYMNERTFTNITSKYVNRVMSELMKGNELFIEKTPSHALFIDLIHRLLPKAKFIHLIRDGRDVAASLLSASRSWGHDWAPASIQAASIMWIKHAGSAQKSLMKIPHSLGLTIKYEDLIIDSTKQLERVSGLIGKKLDKNKVELAISKYEFKKVKKTSRKVFDRSFEPKGFYRKGKVGSWKSEFNIIQKFMLNYYLSPHLKRYGYID